jgi:hypothetical protein
MLRMQAQTEKAIRGSTKSIATLDKSIKAVSATARTLPACLAWDLVFQVPKLIKWLPIWRPGRQDRHHRRAITGVEFQAEQTGSSAEAMAAGLRNSARTLRSAHRRVNYTSC